MIRGDGQPLIPPVIGWTSCPWCDGFVEQRTGKLRIYCDESCRTAMKRDRKRRQEAA